MNILVIGNGFDLAHNFKTSYGNYLDYVDDFNYFFEQIRVNHNHAPDISRCKDENNVRYFVGLFNRFGSDKESRAIIDEQHKLIYNNAWISYFRMRQNEIDDRWVDFESEISRVIQLMDEARHKVLIEVQLRNVKE
ncbi:AbiH family protein [Butyrivibrio sp. INlla16]|uniref:AbiH family protein n=1 Tax=Butyrivibrio sp. INlla16 TaxID=1520807 RepID=UPI00088C02F4|nr:AbiH family protein [Butyrivibrio sp. INlla16]SDB69727.1 Bacteriophage abortive infection AbiH [Butyrivibrio sp. INlla16]